MSKVLIGSDPELFVFNGDQPGSAIGILGGTKEHPRVVERGAVQEDNVLAEFNIDPAATEDEFVQNIIAVRTTLDLLLPHGMYTKVMSSVEYPKEVLAGFGEQALVFGCDPDFNPYTMSENGAPDSSSTLRTAGGHIHIGYDDHNTDRNLDIVQTLDVLLGVPSVLMDGDTRRRSMYGKPGAYRPKPYGVEYRVLSNFWLRSEELMRWAYRTAVKSVEASKEAIDVEKETTFGIPWSVVQAVLNNSDIDAAHEIVKSLGLEVVDHEIIAA